MENNLIIFKIQRMWTFCYYSKISLSQQLINLDLVHKMDDQQATVQNNFNKVHQVDPKCLEPFNYLNQIPGKDIRGVLIDSFQSWLQIPEDKLIVIKDVIATLHNASLLVDDIEDNSKVRRGHPVAHTIYGIAQTINCANYVYFLRYHTHYLAFPLFNFSWMYNYYPLFALFAFIDFLCYTKFGEVSFTQFIRCC